MKFYYSIGLIKFSLIVMYYSQKLTFKTHTKPDKENKHNLQQNECTM